MDRRLVQQQQRRRPARPRDQRRMPQHRADQQRLLLPGTREPRRAPRRRILQYHVGPVRSHRRPTRRRIRRPPLGQRPPQPVLHRQRRRPGQPRRHPRPPAPAAPPGTGPPLPPPAPRSAARPARPAPRSPPRHAGPCCPPVRPASPHPPAPARAAGSAPPSPSHRRTLRAHGRAPASIPAGPGSAAGRRPRRRNSRSICGVSQTLAATGRHLRLVARCVRRPAGTRGGPRPQHLPPVATSRTVSSRSSLRMHAPPTHPTRCAAYSAMRAPRRPTARSQQATPPPAGSSCRSRLGPAHHADAAPPGDQLSAGIVAELGQRQPGQTQQGGPYTRIGISTYSALASAGVPHDRGRRAVAEMKLHLAADLVRDVAEVARLEADLQRRRPVGHPVARPAPRDAVPCSGLAADRVSRSWLSDILIGREPFAADGGHPADSGGEVLNPYAQHLVVVLRDHAFVLGEGAVDQLARQRHRARR